MNLSTILKDLDSFLVETKLDQKKVATLTQSESTTLKSATNFDAGDEKAREIMSAVLSSLPENVSPEVLGAKLLEATTSITEGIEETKDVFKKITAFFEAVGSKCKCLQKVSDSMDDDEDEEDDE